MPWAHLFQLAESFQFLFLHLYYLLPKYIALASQHFLPALTEVGCFYFSLKYSIGTGQASKGRSWSSDVHLQGSCSQHLAFLQGVISHLLMRTLSAPFWGRAEWSYYPCFTDGEAALGSLASAEVPSTSPPATSCFYLVLLRLTPCSRDGHPPQKTGTQLGLHSGLLPSHNGLPFHSQCPQVCTWITGNIIQFTSFELWLPHSSGKNSNNRAGNEIMSASSKWNRCNLDSIYKSQMTCGLNLKTGKMLNCVTELRSGRR